jgi:hypothetical protein
VVALATLMLDQRRVQSFDRFFLGVLLPLRSVAAWTPSLRAKNLGTLKEALYDGDDSLLKAETSS